jgi:hypothetical protein
MLFSFVPAFVGGLINARFRHTAPQFVWTVPALVLACKFATYPSPSVFQSQLSAAFHQYFAGGFLVPDFRNRQELFSIAGSNSDMARGMAQLSFTAPFYAGIGYSLAAWIGRRTRLHRRVAESVIAWEESRFEESDLKIERSEASDRST